MYGGVRLVASLRGGARTLSAPIFPRDPNLPRGNHLGVVTYGVWSPVLQASARGRPTIVGGLPPPLPRGRIPPSPCGWNSHPSLPMISISPLIYTRPRGDGTGSSTASTPSPVPSPVIPSGVIRSVRRDSVVFVVRIVVVALEISTLRTSYHQLSPPNQKSALSFALHAPFEQTDRAGFP